MNDRIRILGVSGRPVLHSMSPMLFRELFRASGVEAAYTRVAASSAEEALGLFRSLGMSGMNLTAPFKEAAASLADELTPEARELGAVNCLVPLESGRVLGANTDMQGVLGALCGRGVDVAGRRCLVIGAGGAGKAAARALAGAGGRVVVVNRTRSRAELLASKVGGEAAGLDELAVRAKDASVIVSTLASDALPDPAAWLPERAELGERASGAVGITVLDADYKQGTLARSAAERGFVVASGLEWLACQAAPAYELFMGHAAAVSPADLTARVGRAELCAAGRRIALIGLMGAGKTATGKALARLLSVPFVDADIEIARQAGMPVAEIFAREGESGFRVRELRAIDRLTSISEPAVLSTGGGAPASAAGGRLLEERCLCVWLHVVPRRRLPERPVQALASGRCSPRTIPWRSSIPSSPSVAAPMPAARSSWSPPKVATRARSQG